jgi:hypothetical protein
MIQLARAILLAQSALSDGATLMSAHSIDGEDLSFPQENRQHLASDEDLPALPFGQVA